MKCDRGKAVETHREMLYHGEPSEKGTNERHNGFL
jgi:hypothetical protein